MNESESTRAVQLQGRYANYFEVGFNSLEFLIDFGQSFEGQADVTLHTRIVTNPVYAQVLGKMLRDVLSQYEEKYGPVRPGESRQDQS